MKYYFKSKISDHIFKDNIGQLICQDAIIAREGEQEYVSDEIFNDGKTNTVTIKRPWDEVRKSASSFEGKPFLLQHPDADIIITPENINDFSVGHVQNVRESKIDDINVLIADIIVRDSEVIEMIESGKMRELSCGYFCDIDEKERIQKNILGEHIALVDSGRAEIAKIIDSKEKILDGTWKEQPITFVSAGTMIRFMTDNMQQIETKVKKAYRLLDSLMFDTLDGTATFNKDEKVMVLMTKNEIEKERKLSDVLLKPQMKSTKKIIAPSILQDEDEQNWQVRFVKNLLNGMKMMPSQEDPDDVFTVKKIINNEYDYAVYTYEKPVPLYMRGNDTVLVMTDEDDIPILVADDVIEPMIYNDALGQYWIKIKADDVKPQMKIAFGNDTSISEIVLDVKRNRNSDNVYIYLDDKTGNGWKYKNTDNVLILTDEHGFAILFDPADKIDVEEVMPDQIKEGDILVDDKTGEIFKVVKIIKKGEKRYLISFSDNADISVNADDILFRKTEKMNE